MRSIAGRSSPPRWSRPAGEHIGQPSSREIVVIPGADAVHLSEGKMDGRANASARPTRGFVTFPCREREVSVPQELLGRCDSHPPRGHRRSAKHAVRLG